MAFRVGFEPLLALNGLVDLAGRDDSLFLQSMRNHDSVPTVEEVEDSIVEPLETDPKLVDPIAQEVRFRSSQLMAQVLEPLEPGQTFVLGLVRQFVELIDNRDLPILFPEKDDLGLGHSLPHLSGGSHPD
jgi:hypothetical protein